MSSYEENTMAGDSTIALPAASGGAADISGSIINNTAKGLLVPGFYQGVIPDGNSRPCLRKTFAVTNNFILDDSDAVIVFSPLTDRTRVGMIYTVDGYGHWIAQDLSLSVDLSKFDAVRTVAGALRIDSNTRSTDRTVLDGVITTVALNQFPPQWDFKSLAQYSNLPKGIVNNYSLYKGVTCLSYPIYHDFVHKLERGSSKQFPGGEPILTLPISGQFNPDWVAIFREALDPRTFLNNTIWYEIEGEEFGTDVGSTDPGTMNTISFLINQDLSLDQVGAPGVRIYMLPVAQGHILASFKFAVSPGASDIITVPTFDNCSVVNGFLRIYSTDPAFAPTSRVKFISYIQGSTGQKNVRIAGNVSLEIIPRVSDYPQITFSKAIGATWTPIEVFVGLLNNPESPLRLVYAGKDYEQFVAFIQTATASQLMPMVESGIGSASTFKTLGSIWRKMVRGLHSVGIDPGNLLDRGVRYLRTNGLASSQDIGHASTPGQTGQPMMPVVDFDTEYTIPGRGQQPETTSQSSATHSSSEGSDNSDHTDAYGRPVGSASTRRKKKGSWQSVYVPPQPESLSEPFGAPPEQEPIDENELNELKEKLAAINRTQSVQNPPSMGMPSVDFDATYSLNPKAEKDLQAAMIPTQGAVPTSEEIASAFQIMSRYNIKTCNDKVFYSLKRYSVFMCVSQAGPFMVLLEWAGGPRNGHGPYKSFAQLIVQEFGAGAYVPPYLAHIMVDTHLAEAFTGGAEQTNTLRMWWAIFCSDDFLPLNSIAAANTYYYISSFFDANVAGFSGNSMFGAIYNLFFGKDPTMLVELAGFASIPLTDGQLPGTNVTRVGDIVQKCQKYKQLVEAPITAVERAWADALREVGCGAFPAFFWEDKAEMSQMFQLFELGNLREAATTTCPQISPNAKMLIMDSYWHNFLNYISPPFKTYLSQLGQAGLMFHLERLNPNAPGPAQYVLTTAKSQASNKLEKPSVDQLLELMKVAASADRNLMPGVWALESMLNKSDEQGINLLMESLPALTSKANETSEQRWLKVMPMIAANAQKIAVGKAVGGEPVMATRTFQTIQGPKTGTVYVPRAKKPPEQQPTDPNGHRKLRGAKALPVPIMKIQPGAGYAELADNQV